MERKTLVCDGSCCIKTQRNITHAGASRVLSSYLYMKLVGCAISKKLVD